MISPFEASVLPLVTGSLLCFQGLVLVYVTVVLVVMARQFRFLNNIDQVKCNPVVKCDPR